MAFIKMGGEWKPNLRGGISLSEKRSLLHSNSREKVDTRAGKYTDMVSETEEKSGFDSFIQTQLKTMRQGQ